MCIDGMTNPLMLNCCRIGGQLEEINESRKSYSSGNSNTVRFIRLISMLLTAPRVIYELMNAL
jgi:hypothetical protein